MREKVDIARAEILRKDAPCVDADGDGYGYGYKDTCRLEGSDCDDRAADVFPGAPETCDGRDENCDGTIDEGLTRECGSNVGECRIGTQTCELGNWGACNNAISSGPELCDGLDNNCSGIVDDIHDPNAVPNELRCPTSGICAEGRAENLCKDSHWTQGERI